MCRREMMMSFWLNVGRRPRRYGRRGKTRDAMNRYRRRERRFLGSVREVRRGTLSMDQSKLRLEGQRRSQAFLAGRWRKVRVRVS